MMWRTVGRCASALHNSPKADFYRSSVVYRAAHEKIRESPEAVLTDKADLAKWKEASKKTHPRKLTLQQRRERVAEKKAAWAAARDQ